MTDVAILDECRTIVPSGYFDIVEIDRTKAFTWAFKQIRFIPVFNEFDSWKHYRNDIDINELSSLTLYMVEVKESNVFLSKRYNLVYGKFLRKFFETNTEIKIFYIKSLPSFIRSIMIRLLMNYGKLISLRRIKRK